MFQQAQFQLSVADMITKQHRQLLEQVITAPTEEKKIDEVLVEAMQHSGIKTVTELKQLRQKTRYGQADGGRCL